VKYGWKDAGEEWSEPWGTSAAQWHGAILPRIRECLPAGTILEIAPGFGRWTNYLREHCNQLWIVDRVEECIEACRKRFADDRRLSYFVNDGRSLSMFPDSSIDFVFSFDSLVHPRREIVQAYLHQLGEKLKTGGKGFIHHSNLGQYANSVRKHLPEGVRKLLIKANILDRDRHRDPTMTAELFRSICEENGLHCVSQELINWRSRRLIDCFSLFTRSTGNIQSATRLVRNPNFMREAAQIRESLRRQEAA
jgi:hypothetical protein